MPIRPENRWLYPIDWPQVSKWVRFVRAQGRCERCGRPHGEIVRRLDLDGDEATLTGFRVNNGSQEDLIGDRFGDLVGNQDDMTITYSQEAVRVEGTAQGEVDGTERKDIPFVMDVGCTTWMGLTNEGDVAPPS